MAIRQRDFTYSEQAFALIEAKGVIYVVSAGAAKDIRKALAEKLVFTSVENVITEWLTQVSEFVFDIPNNKVIKPAP